MNNINIYSEIGKLKKVMLRRPGKELENLTPNLLEELLFDDIPWLTKAREEHDAFANVLRKTGSEVIYLEKLVAEVLDISKEIREAFVHQYVQEADVHSSKVFNAVSEYLLSFESNLELVEKTMAGIRPKDLKDFYDTDDKLFLCAPLPNLYFTRDPFATMGNGVAVHKMHTVTRRRETIYGEYIFKYHKDYQCAPILYNKNSDFSIEGGDILVLNKDTIAVGVSQRTQITAIKHLAKNVFFKNETGFKRILAFDIPKTRAFMHLDTVFTQLDYDKFTIHPEIYGDLQVAEMRVKNGYDLNITRKHDKLENILGEVVNSPVTLIPCGGNDPIAASREQWSDGANTLAIAPGEAIVYSRNEFTNELLDKNGIKLHLIPSSELSRGRGGPRCMSMPFVREKINN